MIRSGISSAEEAVLRDAVEVLPGRLYLRPSFLPPRDTAALHCFSTDDQLVYQPFFLDFGPLNISCIFKYCIMLQKKLDDPTLRDKVLVHISVHTAEKLANAVLLLGCFLVAAMGYTADKAMKPFLAISGCLKPFRDATYSSCEFGLTIRDCLCGLEYAIQLGWFSLTTFNVLAYDHYERLESGDMNWIIPGKFLAFSCPSSGSAAVGTRQCDDSQEGCTPAYYARVFKKLKIQIVIRLNWNIYNPTVFRRAGIMHYDLFFMDGTCPPRSVIYQFLQLCEACDGPIAVHCKAGLGRTGTLIGCYAMKNYKFPALAWIGWNRMCRPGSVLGPQQYFLRDMEDEFMRMNPIRSCTQLLEKLPTVDDQADDLTFSLTKLRLEDERISQHGDEGQGDRLMEAKRRSKPAADKDGGSRDIQVSNTSQVKGGVATQLAPQLDREARACPVASDLSQTPYLDAMLKSKVGGRLPSPIGAGVLTSRRPAGSSCHALIPATASSGIGGAPTSRQANRSRTDV